MTELEARLRAMEEHLPEPDAAATQAARAAMHAARRSAPWARERRRFQWRRPRPFLLATAIVVAVAGGALAAANWSIRDLPPFGPADREAFVLPATDILPGGYERTRPPRYAELPERPSLLFPPGVVGYTDALSAYAATRAAGAVLPPDVVLADPLPAGKVVMVRDDRRIALDPAAPFGYSATTGLVTTLPFVFDGNAIPLARCQLLVGAEDPESPACDAAPRAYVREGVNGRWIPSLIEEELFDPVLPASTELSVVDNPTAPVVQVPARVISAVPRDGSKRRTGSAPGRLALSVDGVRLIVVPLPDRQICFVTQRRSGSGIHCGPRDGFLSRGAVISGGRYGDLPLRLSGLVGDGIEQVSTDDGRVTRVVNNVFTFSPADDIRRLTFSGPVGTFSLPVPRNSDEGRFTPDRTRERELIGIELSGGGRASIRVAPNIGGGRCDWFYVRGDVRSSACSRPSDPPLSYDVVTGGFVQRVNRVSTLFQGRFAPQVGSVEIGYADGDSVRLIPTGGYILFEVPAAHRSPERRATSITTFDRSGVALVRAEVPYRAP
ncbi:MAG: hypothetical protein AB7I38_15945 [Dehalococcoidia bacterium]